MSDRKRIFVVGVPRSGTTLVQSILNAHVDVKGYPETHFFRALFPHNRFCRLMGLTSRACWRYLDELKGVTGDDIGLCSKSIFRSKQVKLFIQFLDQCAELEGFEHWSEKTPGHLHHLKYIETCVVSPCFIHVIRHPYDVVASMYEAARDYPEIWGQRSIQKCCDRWNRDVALSLAYKDQKQHILIRYEDVNCNDMDAANRLFVQIGLNPSGLHSDLIGGNAKQLIKPDEKWKANNLSGMHGYTSDKFRTVLSEEQQKEVVDLIDLGLWKATAR